ncbi:1-phosphofructokinase [Nitzschia inconspicua]|uniref:1-phosphofructokinase n=1 Tax=Nitzschia inconspicua TaxID=303405 RepID=A0A9K3L6Y8_9STRA|nr:1-phosphofructokinase [Nitzschia inconspicua]
MQPTEQPPMVVVGLNGALQKRFILPQGDNLIPGNVHRAAKVQDGVGGKGQDVATALSCLSSTSPQQLVQFVGRGSAGDAVYDMLVDRLGASAMSLTVRSNTEMRTCTSIVAADDTTELVEPSGVIEESELQELYDKAGQVDNQARGVSIMGSMPPGCPSSTYATLYGQIAGPSTVCVVDSVAGIPELIAKAQQMRQNNSAGPIIFKVNAAELCKLAGVSKSKSETDGVHLDELVEAIQKFDAKFSPNGALLGLAVTDGRHPAYFVSLVGETTFQLFRIQVPTLDTNKQTLYPIGAGDAVAAGTLAAWVNLVTDDSCETIPKACQKLLSDLAMTLSSDATFLDSLDIAKVIASFSFGLVCGSASCLQEENSVLHIADVLRLLQQVQPPKLVLTESLTKIQKV